MNGLARDAKSCERRSGSQFGSGGSSGEKAAAERKKPRDGKIQGLIKMMAGAKCAVTTGTDQVSPSRVSPLARLRTGAGIPPETDPLTAVPR